MKRDALDAVFSELVRERANWICEKCDLNLQEYHRGLHCSHNYGRRNRSVRWWPLNALALCHNCHSWFGDYPYDAMQWLAAKLGPLMEILRERAHTPRKYTQAEHKDMLVHYRQQLKLLQEARRMGKTGRLDFEGYD